MNWRIIAGLVFLIVGIGELYAIIEHKATVGLNASPVLAGAGCIVWVAVGIFLIIQGMKGVEK